MCGHLKNVKYGESDVKFSKINFPSSDTAVSERIDLTKGLIIVTSLYEWTDAEVTKNFLEFFFSVDFSTF